MRRKIIDNKAIALIVIIAFFTILSYLTDQLAIRQEDNLRINKIKLNDLNTKEIEYDSLINQLSSISRRSSIIVQNSLRNKNLWIKSYLAINLKNSKQIKYKEYFKNINDAEKNIIKVAMIDNFVTSMRDNFFIERKLGDIYWRNKEVFDVTNWEEFEEEFGGLYDIKRVIKESSNQLFHKTTDFYSNFVTEYEWDGEKLEKNLKEFDKERWLDINLLTIKLIQNIDIKNLDIEKNKDFLENEKSKNKKLKSETLEAISSQSSLKNYFILSSIISQVLSLLFLLIFFRYLIIIK